MIGSILSIWTQKNMNSFENKKQLRFKITLGTTTFGSNGENVIVLDGFRAKVDIEKNGGVMLSQAVCKIYGLSQSDMNSITTLWWLPNSFPRSQIEIYAIVGKQESMVFAGDIITAQGDYQSLPDVFLLIQASTTYHARLQAVEPLSVKGGTKVDVLFDRIAKKLGLQFFSNQVDVTLVDSYFDSDLVTQAKEIAKAANIELVINDKTLSITKKNTSLPGLEPEISKDSGLVGYPMLDGTGVVFRCLYDPAILFKGAINLISEIPKASGRWIVDSVGTYLESETPNGAWFCYIRGSYHGQSFAR